jgi:hypothetical protein
MTQYEAAYGDLSVPQPLKRFEDPMIKSLYDIIWKYWVPTKKKAKSEESLEGEEPAPANVKSKGGQEEDGEMEELEAASDQGEPPCLNDDYVESCLAESLGVPPLAPVVEAVPDSQILPGSFVEELQDSQVQPVIEFVALPKRDPPIKVQEEAVDVPSSPSITPTEIEMTPEPPQVPPAIPVTTTVKDPLPSAKTYTPEDMAVLRDKINMIK